MDFFTKTSSLFGIILPEWIFWALGAIFIILIVVFILKGFFAEIKK